MGSIWRHAVITEKPSAAHTFAALHDSSTWLPSVGCDSTTLTCIASAPIVHEVCDELSSVDAAGRIQIV